MANAESDKEVLSGAKWISGSGVRDDASPVGQRGSLRSALAEVAAPSERPLTPADFTPAAVLDRVILAVKKRYARLV